MNFCCCLRVKENYNVFVEMSFQRLLIGTLSLCGNKQMPKFVKS